MTKTVKIDFSQVIKTHQGEPMKKLSSGGTPEDLTLGSIITDLILGLTSLDNNESIRAWNLSSEIVKSPKDYEIDLDKLDFIIACFEKTTPQALVKGQILQMLRNFKDELNKQ